MSNVEKVADVFNIQHLETFEPLNNISKACLGIYAH